MENRVLMKKAIEARELAYAPYSRFKVGAALLCCDGSVYTGCNIENAAYSPSNCAERTAFFKAISEGKREFIKIAVAGGKDALNTLCAPCGVCRQVMAEFCDPDRFEIILGNDEEQRVYLLKDLLPLSFGTEDIGGKKHDDV